MIGIVGILFLLFGLLLVYPSSWDFVKSVVYAAGKMIGYYWPNVASAIGVAYTTVDDQVRRYYNRLLWTVSGYFAWLVLVTLMAIAAAIGGYTTWFAVFCFTFALSLWPIQRQFVTLAKLSQVYLPQGLQFSEPRLTSVLMVIALNAGVTAILFPHLFFNGYGAVLLVVLMAGTAWLVAYPSPRLYAVKGFAIATLITIGFWGVFWLIPAHAEAAMLSVRNFEFDRGQENLIAKLNERPVQKATATVLGWKVETYPNGSPVLDESGFAKVSECNLSDGTRFTLKEGQVFKTFDLRVSADAGEPLIQVFVPNTDGTWIQSQNSPKCWIPVSRTDLAIAKPKPSPSVETAKVEQSTKSSPQTKAETPKSAEKPAPVKTSFTVPANAVHASGIEVKAGQKVIVKASGKVNSMPESQNYDGTYKWVGPNGWGNLNPGFISEGTKSLAGPLPQGRSYMALTARIAHSQPSLTDGNWILVGNYYEFRAGEDGYLYFIVNEKLQENGKVRMEYLNNNQGEFKVEVKVQ